MYGSSENLSLVISTRGEVGNHSLTPLELDEPLWHMVLKKYEKECQIKYHASSPGGQTRGGNDEEATSEKQGRGHSSGFEAA